MDGDALTNQEEIRMEWAEEMEVMDTGDIIIRGETVNLLITYQKLLKVIVETRRYYRKQYGFFWIFKVLKMNDKTEKEL